MELNHVGLLASPTFLLLLNVFVASKKSGPLLLVTAHSVLQSSLLPIWEEHEGSRFCSSLYSGMLNLLEHEESWI